MRGHCENGKLDTGSNLPKIRLYRDSKDRYHALGVEWGFSFVKTSEASCDEIIVANGHRKSLMSLV
jgi:hypothetical protein